MARIEWDEKEYGFGLDHGVLYLEDDSGVPWNGLVEVTNAMNVMKSNFVYFDGVVVSNRQIFPEDKSTIKAVTYPEEFDFYAGFEEFVDGIFVTNQMKKSFGLSYRTFGRDKNDNEWYKIHILYNLVATLKTSMNDSVESNVLIKELEWEISATPEQVTSFAPTAYVVIDSRRMNPDDLSYIEDQLYGTTETDSQLPPLDLLINGLYLILIINHGDGTWSAVGPDELITMLDPNTFQIEDVNAVYLDADTYDISST